MSQNRHLPCWDGPGGNPGGRSATARSDGTISKSAFSRLKRVL